MEIKSAADLEPKSQGFANRAAESINIIGGVVETLLNTIGGTISDIAGQPHGSHLNINGPGVPANPQERMRRRQFEFEDIGPAPVNPRDRLVLGHPELMHVPVTEGSIRIQQFIDENVPQI